MGAADGTDGFGRPEQCADRLEYLFLKRMAFLRDEACEVVTLEVLPEPFDGVEVRTVGREVNRLDVMPVQPFCLMPACVVEDEQEALAFPLRDFGGHGVEEGLEDFRVAVRDDEADKLPVGRVHGSDDVPAQVAAVVALHRARAAFHPLLPGPGIAFEAGLVAEKHFAGWVVDEIEQFVGEVLAPDFPCLAVGRLGHAAGDLPGVAVLVEIAVEGAAGEVELLLFAEVAAKLGERPMCLAGQGRVVHEGKDHFGDDVRRELPAPAAPGTVDEPVDAELVETRDPEAEGAFAHPAVA